MNRIPVAHSVNPYLPASGSWIYSQIINLRRYEPLVLTKRKENVEHFPFSPIFAQYDLPLPRRVYEKIYKRLTRSYFPLYRRVLVGRKVPLLHSHFCTYGMEDSRLKRDLGIAHLTTFYGSDIWVNSMDAGWRRKFREFAQVSDMFLVEGGAMREKVLSLGAPDDKVRTLHLGVDMDRIDFKPRAVGGDGVTRILMAGRAIEKKGHMYGLTAFERLCRKYPGIRLDMIVGGRSIKSDAIKKQMRRFIAEKGIEDRVDWVEFMPYSEYLEKVRNAHIFLQPSVHAEDGDAEGGFPVTIIELSASGAPVVGTRHCDIPEAVIDGRTGLLADERDVDGIAERLEYLIQRPETWPEFGRAGREHVGREYNIRTQVGLLEDTYDHVLQGTKA